MAILPTSMKHITSRDSSRLMIGGRTKDDDDDDVNESLMLM